MKFRPNALARREAPDDLATPVGLVPLRSWTALILLGALVAGGVAWGFAGRIPQTLDAGGVLSSARGSFRVEAPAAGQVSSIGVTEGEPVGPKDTVVGLVVRDRAVRVRTAVPGRVVRVLVQQGRFVGQGEPLVVVERVDPDDRGRVAVLWVPAASGVLVLPRMRAEVAVDAAPAAVFGRIRGRVLDVGVTFEGLREIADFVGDDDVAAALAGGGAVRRVVVELERDPATASGFAWTRGSGPPFAVTAATGVRGTIFQPSTRPVDWLLP